MLNVSPGVNGGNNVAVVSTKDADGMPRIRFNKVDMGAYESQEPTPPPPPGPPIPSASAWSLAIMATLLATAGTILLRRAII